MDVVANSVRLVVKSRLEVYFGNLQRFSFIVCCIRDNIMKKV